MTVKPFLSVRTQNVRRWAAPALARPFGGREIALVGYLRLDVFDGDPFLHALIGADSAKFCTLPTEEGVGTSDRFLCGVRVPGNIFL